MRLYATLNAPFKMTDTASNDTPAADPPPGVTPNFVNPPSLHSVNLGVSIACLILMIVVVGVRTYTKAAILRDMRHEDCRLPRSSHIAALLLTLIVIQDVALLVLVGI